MPVYIVTDTSLTSVADAIRTKGGTSSALEFPTGFVSAIENIPSGGGGTYQAKTGITPTTSSQTITPDSGYDALSSVQINAMPSGSATAPQSISGSSASVTTGTDTITLTKSVSVTPNVTAGYVASGTAGNTSVSLTASVATQAAQTIHPSASDQTIAASRYLTGAQTIKGVTVSGLEAGNIKSGVTVKVGDGTDDDCVTSVLGTFEGGATNFVTGTFTTGSSAGIETVTIDYSGSGYPIMCIVVVDGGAYESGTEWYTSTQRYAVGQWTMTKSVWSSAPTYGTSGAANQGVTTWIYKNSTSSSTSYARSSAMNTNVFSSSSASNAGATCIRFNGDKAFSYYVNTSSYGLHPGITYRYYIVYSE